MNYHIWVPIYNLCCEIDKIVLNLIVEQRTSRRGLIPKISVASASARKSHRTFLDSFELVLQRTIKLNQFKKMPLTMFILFFGE